MSHHLKLYCSFCGKPATEVKKLLAGPSDICMCNECVDLCHTLLHGETGETPVAAKPAAKPADPSLPTPREIKEFLDGYVIGQDQAKQALAVAVYKHYRRLDNPVIDGVEIEKSNILMIGPTGSGKTLLAQTIARMLDVPFAMADATSLTEAGYVGDDVESIITRLLQAADQDVKRAERGIIFLDELDKKRGRESSSGGRDVSGEGVQQALLKLLEGSEVMASPTGSKKNGNTELVKVNTRNILFVLGGAFVGLDKIVERAITKGNSSMGYGADPKKAGSRSLADLMDKLEPEHLIQFGLIPELVGRLPVTAVLSDLDGAQLVKVLTEPKNALVKQFIQMFKLDGIDLEFSPEALAAVAEIARTRKTGGRALRSVLESKLLRTQFDLPDLRRAGATRVIVGTAAIAGGVPEVIYEPAAVPAG